MTLTRWVSESGATVVSASTWWKRKKNGWSAGWPEGGSQSERKGATYHQADLVEIRRHSRQDLDLPEQVKVEGRHPVVVRNGAEKVHKDELRVSLSSVAGLAVGNLERHAALDDDDGWNSVGVSTRADTCWTTRKERSDSV